MGNLPDHIHRREPPLPLPEEDGVFNQIFGFDTNDNLGYILDIVGTYQWSDRVTLMSQFNWTREEGFDAEAYGVAEYFIYKINNCMTGIVRFEIFRDDDGLFVNQYAQNDDFINLERGELGALDPRTHSGGDSTYTALTLGLNIKPYEHLLLRPEIRMDWASGGNAPFDDSSDNKQFTLGFDVIWSF